MHQIPSLLLQPSILGESGKPNDSTDVFASPVGTGSAVWMSFSLFDHLDCCQFDEFTGVSVVSPDPSTSSEAERICECVFLLLHFVFLCTCCSWNCEPFSCFYLFLFSSRLHWSWRIFLSVVSERLNVRTSECLTSCPAVSYHVEQVASPLPPQRNSFRAWPAASPAAPISPPPVFGVQVTVNVIVGQSANTSTVPPQRRSDCSSESLQGAAGSAQSTQTWCSGGGIKWSSVYWFIGDDPYQPPLLTRRKASESSSDRWDIRGGRYMEPTSICFCCLVSSSDKIQ